MLKADFIFLMLIFGGAILYALHFFSRKMEESTNRICREIRAFLEVQQRIAASRTNVPAPAEPLTEAPDEKGIPAAASTNDALCPEAPISAREASVPEAAQPTLPPAALELAKALRMLVENPPTEAPASSSTIFGMEAPSFSVQAPTDASRGWNWFWYGREEVGPNENREFIAASNWLIRFGMLVLVLGLGFFVKYSIEQGWLGPEMRIFGTTILGMGMFALGLKFWRTTLNLLGQALIAGGACVLYFSAYGASGLYSLIPEPLGVTWSCAVTVLLAVTALRWNSRLIAVLGTLGAFLTPILFPFMQENLPLLAIYLAVPALGILLIRRNRNWSLAAWIAFWGTYCLWEKAFSIYAIEDWPLRITALLMTVFFMAVFHLIAQRRFRNLPTSATPGDLTMAFLSALLFGIQLTDALEAWNPGLTVFGLAQTSAFFLVVMGGIACGYLLLQALLRPTETNHSFRAMNCALAFLMLGLSFTSLSHWLLPCFLVLCVPFQSAAQKVPSNVTTWLVRAFAILAGIIALFVLAEEYYWTWDALVSGRWSNYCGYGSINPGTQTEFSLWLLGTRTLRFLTPGVCLVLMAVSALRATASTPKITGSLSMAQTFGFLGITYLLSFFTMETNLSLGVYLPAMRLGGISIIWTLFALSLLAVGLRWSFQSVRYGSLILFSAAICKIFFVDLASLDQIWRISAFVLLGILILCGGVIYLKSNRSTPEET